jgi:magnesium transporter
MLSEPIKVLVDTVQKLERRNAGRSLRKILSTTRPEDLAEVLRFLGENQRKRLFDHIEDVDARALVLAELDKEVLPNLLEQMTDDEIVPLLETMSGDDTVDVLVFLPDERRDKLLSLMSSEEMDEAHDLLRYDPETAGGLMVPDYFALERSTTCAEAIGRLQDNSADLEMAFYLYVLNENGHLVGVVSLRQLVISSPSSALESIMEPDVVRVTTGDDQEQVAGLVARYNLLAVPVVDDANRLVGIVTVDDVIDVIRQEATEDMLRMAGAGQVSFGLGVGELGKAARSRMPWLLATLVGGVGASFIIHSFEEQMMKVALLAAFIPVIIGMAGNVGTQSLTIVTRGLALGHIDVTQTLRVAARELAIGMTGGFLYGILLGVVAAVFGLANDGIGTPERAVAFGASVAISLAGAMVIAAVVGSVVPMMFQRLSIDPAVATGPFVTTAVDILGVLFYFGVAVLLLGI